MHDNTISRKGIEKTSVRILVGVGEPEPTLERVKAHYRRGDFRGDAICLFTDKKRGFVPVKEVWYSMKDLCG